MANIQIQELNSTVDLTCDEQQLFDICGGLVTAEVFTVPRPDGAPAAEWLYKFLGVGTYEVRYTNRYLGRNGAFAVFKINGAGPSAADVGYIQFV